MNTTAYFESLTDEIRSMKNRIRNFIGDVHWLTDGEWKETVTTGLKWNHFHQLKQNHSDLWAHYGASVLR